MWSASIHYICRRLNDSTGSKARQRLSIQSTKSQLQIVRLDVEAVLINNSRSINTVNIWVDDYEDILKSQIRLFRLFDYAPKGAAKLTLRQKL